MYRYLFILLFSFFISLISVNAQNNDEKIQQLLEEADEKFSQGKNDDGLSLLLQTIELNKDDPKYPRMVASVYMQMQETEKGISYYLMAIDRDIAKYGKDHQKVANSRSNLAQGIAKMGDYNTALPIMEIAANDYQTNPDPDIAFLVEVMGGLAALHHGVGNYDDAIATNEKLIEYANNNPEVGREPYASAIVGIGFSLKLKNRLDEALLKYLEAEKLYTEIYGANSPDVAIVWNNLGGLYSSMEQYDTSLEYYLRALENAKKNLAEDDPFIPIRMSNIGNTLTMLNRHKEAIEYHLQSLDIIKGIYPENHPYLGTLYNNLGNSYRNNREYDKGITYLEKALDILINTRGPNHNYTIATQSSLDNAKREQRTNMLIENKIDE